MDDLPQGLAEQVSREDWYCTPAAVRQAVSCLLTKLALAEDSNRWIPFLDAISLGVAVHDAEGQLMYLNPVGQALLKSPVEVSAVDQLAAWFQVYRENSPDLYGAAELPSTRALAGERVEADDLEIRHLDRKVSLYVGASPVFDDQGRVTHAIAIFKDISERKRREADYRAVVEALRESELRYRNMVANVPGVVFRYLLRSDGSDRVLYMSPGCYSLWEVEAEVAEKDASILWEMVHPEDQAAMYESVRVSGETLTSWFWSWRIITPSGKEKWLKAAGQPARQANGDVIWDTLIFDATDQARSEALYQLLAENTNDLICLHNPDGCYLYVSPSCRALLGYDSTELIGQNPYQFFHPEDCDRIQQESHAAALSGNSRPVTYRMRHQAGHYIWFETLTKAILDTQGQVVNLQTTSREVTERIKVQEQLRYEAVHDALTQLPNRNLLMERLALAIGRSQRSADYQFAVLFIDLDRFKVINDSLGHLAGDQLLISVAQRLQANLRTTDLAARLGGDEFVILLEEIRGLQEAIGTTERLFEALRMPLEVEGHQVHTNASIGIVLGSGQYHKASHLLRDADTAMYQAKAQGRSRYEVFNAEMHAQALARLRLENDLRVAIDRQDFVLHYQPVVNLNTGELVGFEALARWQHPTRGLILPGEFISVAEETGLITALDYWALSTACGQMAQWQSQFSWAAKLRISVNLSAQDLHQSDLLARVDQVLNLITLTPNTLVLEITESMLIEDAEATITLLECLQARGVKISLDDFGTGYSSLAYLHRLPINSLKIDRSFVQQMQPGQRNHQIIETILALSDQLELAVIAEGSETAQQVDYLQQLGCKYAQGHFFSHALNQADATALLAANPPTLFPREFSPS
jgi:diguanylate cyclase (GGDEF)-like protein/PAS domain S-box-containing protein